ncbi:MAG: N-[(2S)-2-amino-2-carboxyethyl]-L-glutamate dehydrogenase [Actinomycetota bacterium]|nr:N-[(2S)-2-amino-2-carboxyethyl]-L-glutamate dehydrogenase [Actinomycetota bacterium]
MNDRQGNDRQGNALQGELLYLSRADVAEASGAGSDLFVAAVADAFALHARGQTVQPLKPYLRWRPDGHIADRIIAMPAYVGGERPVAGLKWIGSKHDNPERAGTERASALIVLNDPDTHEPVAVMEGALISAARTAAVTAVAARHLAQPGFRALTCVGCGPIGRHQVLTLLEQFPSVDTVWLYDVKEPAAVGLAQALAAGHPKVEVRIAADAETAVRAGDVVVTATVADGPWLPATWLRPGTFLSNVSIMDAGKDVFLSADKVVVDDWDQCNREGKVIHQLTTEGSFSRERLHAELGQVVIGDRPGRESAAEVILLNSMGMAVIDVACAKAVYDRARQAKIGTWLPR